MLRLFFLVYLIEKFQIVIFSLKFSIIVQNPDHQTARVKIYLTTIASLTVELKT